MSAWLTNLAIETIDQIDCASRNAVTEYHLLGLNELFAWVEDRVPFYRDRVLAGSGPDGRLAPLDEISRVPILTKPDVRTNRDTFIATGVRT